MPVTTLDPKTALIVIDLQKGLSKYPLPHSFADIVARSRKLADAFRARGLPVVLVNAVAVAPGRTEQQRPNLPRDAEWTELMPELGRQPSDIVVSKRTWGVFASTDLEKQLRDLGVTQVVVTGVATGSGVESTARQAYEAGFNVTLATDAMTDMRAETHDFVVVNTFPRLGETGTTQDILALLKRS
jgi:nicotinamidase-related amidase